MIMPQWFVTGLILLATLGILGNLVFLISTIVKEIKGKSTGW